MRSGGWKTVSSDWPMRANASGRNPRIQRMQLMEYLDDYLEHCRRNSVSGALVWDIDDTLVENGRYEDYLIPETVAKYKKYETIFPTYIITARPASARFETLQMLRKNGIKGYQQLFLLPPSMERDPGEWKFRKRCAIERMNKRILATIGDQAWDAIRPDDLRHKRLRDLKHGPHGGSLVHCRKHREVGIVLPAR